MPRYTLAPLGDLPIWSGSVRPTQDRIDERLRDVYRGDCRIRTLELYCNGTRIETVAHRDYDGPADDPSELTAVENN